MNTNQIAHIASLVGEPARTGMLMALMDGRALTAHELAEAGRITPATASRHLGLLVEANLLAVERQGRHRYHRLASAEVAKLLESIMQLATHTVPAPRAVVSGPRDAAMRTARTCYDHLAGRLGVVISDHLLAAGAVVFDGEHGHVTDQAGAVLQRLGISASEGTAPRPAVGKRAYCRPCLDWSERRAHLAGHLGALICTHCLSQGWLMRRAGTRAVAVTPGGAVALRNWLGQEHWGKVAALAG